MELGLFLWKYKMTASEFAKKIGCCYSTITAYVRKTRRPGLKTAEKIEKFTNGEVKAVELITGKYQNIFNNDEFASKPRDIKESVESNHKICL